MLGFLVRELLEAKVEPLPHRRGVAQMEGYLVRLTLGPGIARCVFLEEWRMLENLARQLLEAETVHGIGC